MAEPKPPRKDGREAVALLQEAGWSVEKKKKAFKLKCPHGMVIFSVFTSPKNNDQAARAKTKLGRCERTCQSDS